MNVNSNSYTFIFSTVMVVVVAVLLAAAALGLKPAQDRNIELEKQQNILSAVGIVVEREAAKEAYEKYITAEMVIDFNGTIKSQEPKSAFAIDMASQMGKAPEQREYPLFQCKLDDGKTCYIIPMRGKGLWGPIWGYVSIQEDFQSVFGATFDHKSETPGLGAEITTPYFTGQFPGKKIINENGEYVSVAVIKPGAEAKTDYNVDGISGGTITSRGVGEMLERTLKVYVAYFNTIKPSAEPALETTPIDSNNVVVDSTAITTASI